MVFQRDPYDPAAPAGQPRYRSESPWSWAIGALAMILVVAAIFVWGLPADEPLTTGAVSPVC